MYKKHINFILLLNFKIHAEFQSYNLGQNIWRLFKF